MQIKKAFTLVELIVVITILAILGTIGFISLQGYSSESRDSKRISDLGQIKTGLGIEQAREGRLPTPDEAVNVTNSGSDLTLQGYAGTGTLNTLRVSDNAKDPLDDLHYTYTTNPNQTRFQLVAMLENDPTASLVAQTYADYENRYPYNIGDGIGTLLTNTKIPIQEVITGVLDLGSDNDDYIPIFNREDNNVAGSGSELVDRIVENNNSSDNLSYSCENLFGDADSHPDFDLCTDTIVLNSFSNIPDSSNLTNNNGGRDVYALLLEQGNEYIIETIGSSNPDTRIYLYDNNGGNYLMENDDFNGYLSRLDFIPEETGYYYLGVMGYGDGGTNSDYGLKFTVNDLSKLYIKNDSFTFDGLTWYVSSNRNVAYNKPSGSNDTPSNLTASDHILVFENGQSLIKGTNAFVLRTVNEGATNPYIYGETYVTNRTWNELGTSYFNGESLYEDDKAILGDFFQWGRNDPVSLSATGTTLYSDTGYQTGGVDLSGTNFITNSTTPYSWMDTTQHNNSNSVVWTDTNNSGVCPTDYHLPTTSINVGSGEWRLVIELVTGTTGNWNDSHIEISQKYLLLPLVGYRNRSNGDYDYQGIGGYYWSSSANGDDGHHLTLSFTGIYPSSSSHRAYGSSVRCFKN